MHPGKQNDLNLNVAMANGFKFQIINALIESTGVIIILLLLIIILLLLILLLIIIIIIITLFPCQ